MIYVTRFQTINHPEAFNSFLRYTILSRLGTAYSYFLNGLYGTTTGRQIVHHHCFG
jgi:hypothetical protein